MIEKIMKAVKSSNKRRGRNITIGAVVGFLLSCTAVMGADDNYLWIKNDNGVIKFSTDNSEPALTDNPYVENNWLGSTETYINNTILSADGTDSIAYGVKLELNSPNFRFINNGAINASSNSEKAYGIYVDGGEVGNIENNGTINGSSNSSNAYGIYVNGGEVGNIENNGIINTSSNSSSAYGIYVDYGKVGNIENNGVITGDSGTGHSIGIRIYDGGSATQIINRGIINNKISPNDNSSNNGNMGIIIASSSEGAEKIINIGEINSSNDGNAYAYGIRVMKEAREVVNVGNIKTFDAKYSYGISSDNSGSSAKINNLLNMGTISSFGSTYSSGIRSNNNGTIEKIVNTGVVYGQNNAVYIGSNAAIGNGGINNYGILATDGDNAISNGGNMTGTENNYGMYITKKEGQITINVDNDKSNDKPIEVVVGYNEDGSEITKSMTIRNAKLNEEETETESFILAGKSGEFDNSILNGKDKTLKVSGKGNQITDSIINAYQTAVVMEGTKSSLVLNNTVVNGGAAKDGDVPTIEIKGEHSTLTLKGESIVNTGARDNVAITVGGKNNALVLEGNAKVNGEMTSTGTNNLISLNGNAGNGMNILHNISGFTNMNIDNNVTFFENVEVTGTETVTVGGTLNLRLKKSEPMPYGDIPTAVHAFSGTNSTTIKGASEEEAGTLNFITNGIGREIYVDMENIELENMKVRANSIIDKVEISDEYIHLGAGSDLSGIVNPKVSKYDSLDKIYKSLYSSTEENLDALRDILSMTYLGTHYGYNTSNEEQLKNLMSYLDSIYTGTPYSVSSELSRRSVGMFRDIVTENQFRPDLNRWLVMGGLTHTDGGTKDSYYGQNYHGFDTGTADVDTDMKLTGAYALGKYGYSENVSLGVTAGGNKSEAKLPMSKVKGNSGYVGAFAENYRGNLTLKAGAGIQYSEYDANRATLGGHSYSEKYSDMAYDIYLNGRYSNPVGDNFFLEPYGTLSYTYVDQEGADEGSKVLAIETDSKSFDYTTAKVGVDLKKVIPHEKGKSTLSAGVSYTRLLNGADKDNITGRFKGKDASDFDILVAHKNENSIGLNAKYTLELESGILFDVKGSYSVERDSHNGTGKNRNKGEWIVGTGLGYKF
ncbi:autotransporter outer membrane beta-barrel domain-containing protein [Fusobacterium varium]|uniref:autotransporter outer membrane beta-barrel domain-containing protein n=1 Tax=Fusobacterium varium TaxID=856 RepID=UPI00164DA553|nr:autotransporter outer membrane beta-barrel domain-containing protein [Fusobacterium varium]